LRAPEDAEARVSPRRKTESSMRSAAWRAAKPSTLGMGMVPLHLEGMARPAHVKPPKHLSKSPPVPRPQPADESDPPEGEEHKPDPTRYGDWEKKGIAVDF
jgi:hypothetical protein